jgi:hypothetical protein
LQKVLEVEEVFIADYSQVTQPDHIKKAEQAVPGKPSFFFTSKL